MAVPKGLRETKPTKRAALMWVAYQLVALFVLYHICFNDSVWKHLVPKFAQAPHTASRDIKILALMVITCRTVSQSLWGIFLCPYSITPTFSAFVMFFNVVLDTIAVTSALRNRTEISARWDIPVFTVAMFGLLLERYSDCNRAWFKARTENKGKMHTSGPFRYVVHPNYLGYIIFRSAFFALGGVWYLQIVSVYLILSFVYGDILIQKDRNTGKYGEEFKRYWDTTPKLFPTIYLKS